MTPSPSSRFQISPVRSAEDLESAVQLFTTYTDSLGIDLSYQNYGTEIANMPGRYAPPTGELFLCRNNTTGKAIGCVGFRDLNPALGWCEMKRLYVSPAGRGMGIGSALLEKAMETARNLGYKQIVLDTLSSMTQAIELYKRKGFEEIPPYYETPMKDTVFMKYEL